jgi:hypothetical protein
MRKERFHEQRRSKLMPQGDGPFQIIERIIDNAYKVDLPGESTFNVTALSLFNIGDDSRSNPFEERGDDATSAPKDPLEVKHTIVSYFEKLLGGFNSDLVLILLFFLGLFLKDYLPFKV